MIRKYCFGSPFETEAVVEEIQTEAGEFPYGSVSLADGFTFTYSMDEEDIVYGMGEAVRGINKRGHLYISDCEDDVLHTESRNSLYSAHNLLVISGKTSVGFFFDYPAAISFDIGYSRQDLLKVSCRHADLKLYVIDGADAYDIVKQFRRITGRSYIPPKFAFGYGQSRCGYKTKEDFRKVAKEHREQHVPLDMIYMDIDYMQNYKDFTLNEETFDHFPEFVEEMKAQQIHLIPIIDAAVKVEKGYPVYDEGIEKDYFCKRADGSNFVAKVWPGETHFPDVLNPEARKWFGGWYKVLIDQGIEGFWNDMNEPSIFYSTEGMAEFREELQKFLNEEYDPSTPSEIFPLKGKMSSLSNSRKDFARFYHKVNGKSICHADVHNLYGYNMTRAAAEAFEQIAPGKRFLLFSRSSYIGMHRYGGIWTGDNKSWWSHLLLNLKMLPSLNMCGFLYSGADLGGFTENTTRDLLLRWLALGVFTPLMRNHSASEREQEFYQFEHPEDFRGVIETRYRLLPYIYSEYMKAVLTDDVYFKPMAFVYPKDELALRIEDQLMIGNEVMIAPVYTQNAVGRMVYLPERMLFVKFGKDGAISQELLEKGHHFVKVALHEVPLFIREGACIPVAKAAEWVSALDTEDLELIGFDGASYRLYDDDGETQNYRSIEECKVLEKK